MGVSTEEEERIVSSPGVTSTVEQQTEPIPSGPGGFPSPGAEETPTNPPPRSRRA